MALGINSDLWKAAQLVTSSTFFPVMVQAACWRKNVPYTPQVLYFVAVRRAIVTAFTMGLRSDGARGSVDDALVAAVESGVDVDALILNAVEAYVPPA